MTINEQNGIGNDYHHPAGVENEHRSGFHATNGVLNGVNGLHSSNGTCNTINPVDPDDIHEPIAVVGMGMRLPGEIRDSQSFWDFLINKKSARARVPDDRWNVDAFYNGSRKPETVTTDAGYFLNDLDLRDFDAGFFSLSKAELERLDPQQRLLLEVTWECMENAGQTNWRGKNIGCWVGVFGEDWLDIQSKDMQDMGMYRITGSGDFVLGNRVSYEYDLNGPSMTVKTGCSSSLICLHLACEAVRSGDCDSAVVAGTNLLMSPTMTIAMSEQGVLSPTGCCKSFDAAADGYARGEAINALYVKRLKDALRDGDPIRAIIRGSATNCDGKTPGISCPSSESHEALIRRAYEAAGIQRFSETAMVECHGTGTAVGDPLETRAVANVFGGDGVYIGSVKPNVGHSEGASGLTSTIKMILALENRTIPPNILFNTPNPKIPFAEAKLSVPVEPTPWPLARAGRVSVNSFGIGGANAHVVLESASSFYRGAIQPQPGDLAHHELLVFSANHSQSLTNVLLNYSKYLNKSKAPLDALAYTLGARRNHMPYRSFCITDGTSSVEFAPSNHSASTQPDIAFVFTGQGAQWAEMGKELTSYPAYLEDIRALDGELARCTHPPSWSIEEELMKSKEFSLLNQAEFSQPLCTAVQIALVNLLRSWNIHPKCVVGHSSGEIAAAYACHAITAREAILVAYYRGLITKNVTSSGGMAAIGLGRDAVSPHLVHGVNIACENSYENVTISGDTDALEQVIASVKESNPKAFMRSLRVEKAYHSYHMAQVGEEYEKSLNDSVSSLQPSVPLYSSVSGNVISKSGKLNAGYWRANLESPVLFKTAVESILSQDCPPTVFVEIGPHAALGGPLRQIFQHAGVSPVYIPTLKRNEDGRRTLLSAVGQLFCHGVQVEFSAMTTSRDVLTDLPTYPWHYEGKYWNESRLSRGYRLRQFPHHDILGTLTPVSNEFEPTWRNILKLENVPWIEDHRIRTDTVFPGAGYIAMVGEAIRQLTGAEDYSVRNVSIIAAMVFDDSRGVETMTVVRPAQLTVSLDSAWYEFSISSFNGSSWTKHCIGQARAGSDNETFGPEKSASTPRRISSPKWYQTMGKVGLNYGPAFQGLEEISASINEHVATAIVDDMVNPEESAYALHPSTLDLCFQLFSVALVNGQSRKFNQLSIPTFIEEMSVRKTPSKVKLEVHTERSNTGAVRGAGVGTADDGSVVLKLQGLKLSPVEGEAGRDVDPHAAVQLHWKPDVDFLQDKDLIRLCKSVRPDHILSEKLTVLCILEASSRLAGLTTDQSHFSQYIQWIEEQKARIMTGEYPIVESIDELACLDPTARQEMIEVTYAATQATDAWAVGKALIRLLDNCQDIVHGKIDALELLLQDEVLTQIYGFAGLWNYKEFFDAVTHEKPHLRILEIGAGTGATTAAILKHLTGESGERLYAKYTFTDISAGFFVAARERFRDYTNIEYAALDISKDPIEQGFKEHSYDLILASNVLHATPSLHQTLLNARKLLAPRGRLFLQELCPTTKWVNFIMGIFPGWWLGDADGRIEQPFVSPERWNDELLLADFSGAETILYDDEYPYQINANIIARPSVPISAKRATLMYRSDDNPVVRDVEAALIQQGIDVDVCKFPELPPTGQDLISLLDLESAFFVNISSEDLRNFLDLMAFLQNHESGILWVTKASQIHCKDPNYSPVIGMSRTIRSELGFAFATLELDQVNAHAWDSLCGVFSKFQRRSKEEDVDSDSEFALLDGVVHISRFHWIVLSKELLQNADADVPKSLEIGNRGLLQTLHWQERPDIYLAPDEVEVESHAVGMNFKDVLIAMGIVEGLGKDSSGLGCECAGVVRAVGTEVGHLAVGDRVMIVSPVTLSTRFATKGQLCVKIPDDLTFEDAATMPCVYATVVYALLELGRLEKDQTVLIHSAAGGVGIAAIQVCQWVGASIFVTVGSDTKAQYLMETFGIPRDRIFNSRDTSFLPNILRATQGRGVDVALNSLSGELLHATWKCVADFGKMLEIGKRDFIGQGKLNMKLFEANRSFHGIDLSGVCNERPNVAQRLLQKIVELYNAGVIKPIRPIKTFDAEYVEEAFRYLQKGTHMGKVVISMSENKLQAVPSTRKLLFRADAAYLMIGGLGGLGQAVSTWMVEHGAQHLVFMSRTAGKSTRDSMFIEELEAQGCSVQIFAGSVSVLSDVEHAVRNTVKPIAGVMQMSMVLRDQAFGQISIDDWNSVVAPKIDGTWNLHKALMSEKLDFFILFSSFSGLVGQWGQANYAASNTFLDAFAQYRREQGLPATVLDIGAVVDTGYVSENKAVLNGFLATAVHGLHEQDVLDGLHMMVIRSAPSSPEMNGFSNPGQIGIGLRSTQPMSLSTNRIIWKRDPRMSLYRNLEEVSEEVITTTNHELKTFLLNARNSPATLDSQESVHFLARQIGLRLFEFLLKPKQELDIKLSLTAVGLDSLIAIEMRNWWKQTLGFEVTVLEILAAGSIEQLGALAALKLKLVVLHDTIEALKPHTVVAGHKRAGTVDGVFNLRSTREYILAFKEAIKTTSNWEELWDKMKNSYPGRINPHAILAGAVAAFNNGAGK